jgi:hypothetical protein
MIFLTNIGPEHYNYNIELTKNNFNEIILFQNSPVQPLLIWVPTQTYRAP